MEIFIHNLALGQLIQVLSLLLHINDKTVIITPSPWFFSDLTHFKSVFNISDDQLVIKHHDVGPNNTYGDPGDHAKPLSPYIKPNEVNLFGKNFSAERHNKPCIGIAMAKNPSELHKLINQGIDGAQDPDGRYHDYGVYEKIIRLVLNSGYDVMTFNVLSTLEEKVFQISQQCEAVICYEGGMAHLAHCFDVPCIMLPWQQKSWAPADEQRTLFDSTYGVSISRAEILHMDRSTYFLESADEIMSWTSDDLCDMIGRLHHKQGNSKLLTEEMAGHITKRSIYDFLIVANCDRQTREMVENLMTKYHIGGYTDLELPTTFYTQVV